jgi:hypothetical protein
MTYKEVLEFIDSSDYNRIVIGSNGFISLNNEDLEKLITIREWLRSGEDVLSRCIKEDREEKLKELL